MRPDKYPFLRILIPLSLGIATGYIFCTHQIDIPSFFWIFPCVIAFFLYLIYKKKKEFSRRWLPGISIYLILFSAGGHLSQNQYQDALFPWPENPQHYEILLRSAPEERQRTYSFEALARGYRHTKKPDQFFPIQKKILLYLPKSDQTKQLQPGDFIYIKSTIQSPQNNGNPEEFNYRDYLLRKGISGTTYTKEWTRCGVSFPSRSLVSYAEAVRMKLLSIYQKAGIHGEEYSILAALTLGYKESLSEETRLHFSQAGISHVLALSGLHVGFVYILLEFILSFILRSKNSPIKQFIIILLLWGFAFLTGLLPPVIRATIMCSLVALARIHNAQSLSINTLSAAAFLTLCFRPLWLFEASFQLSFTAVAGILLWQPWLSKQIRFQNRFLRYIWGIICISSTAQLAVLPFILYYFSSFPSYFLLTNIAALGLVSMIIYTGFALLLLHLSPSFVQFGLGRIIQEELHLLHKTVEKIGQLPGSQITDLYISSWEAWSLALLLFTGMHYLTAKDKKPAFLLIALAGGCVLTSSEISKTLQSRHYFPSILFYSSYNCPALHLITNKKHSYLWTDSTQQGYPFLLKSTSPFRNKLSLSKPNIIQNDSVHTFSPTHSTSGIIRFQHKTICHVKNRDWKNKVSKNPLTIDYLWISKGYYDCIKSLQSLFIIKEVVIDASVPEAQQRKLEQECLLLHVPCTRISLHGAYFIPLYKK